MRKIIVSLWLLLLWLAAASPVAGKSLSQEVREEAKEVRQEVKQEVRENLREMQGLTGTPGSTLKLSLRQQIWERLREAFPFLLPAGINRATISSIEGTTLPTAIIVEKDGKSITLNITSKTKILRKFGGKSSLSELHVGDIVTARGTWQGNENAVLDTRVLRDLSIQKRRGSFWGKIKSISESSFVLETSQRGDQTVNTDAKTKIVDRRERVISFADLKVGHRVRVTGLWDLTLKTIDEVRTIKDWSVGPNPTAAASPAP